MSTKKRSFDAALYSFCSFCPSALSSLLPAAVTAPLPALPSCQYGAYAAPPPQAGMSYPPPPPGVSWLPAACTCLCAVDACCCPLSTTPALYSGSTVQLCCDTYPATTAPAHRCPGLFPAAPCSTALLRPVATRPRPRGTRRPRAGSSPSTEDGLPAVAGQQPCNRHAAGHGSCRLHCSKATQVDGTKSVFERNTERCQIIDALYQCQRDSICLHCCWVCHRDLGKASARPSRYASSRMAL